MSYSNSLHIVSKTATGAIGAFLCVQPDLGNDNYVKVATANSRCLGVGPNYSVADTENIPVSVGGEAQVLCGGTVLRGDRLKSDSAGKVVAIATGGTPVQNVIGIAAKAGVSGDVIPIQVEIYTVAPGDYLS